MASNAERIAELKRLVKSVANRREEVRDCIEALNAREEVLHREMHNYCAALRELGEWPSIADVTHDRPPSREDVSSK